MRKEVVESMQLRMASKEDDILPEQSFYIVLGPYRKTKVWEVFYNGKVHEWYEDGIVCDELIAVVSDL